MENPDLLPPPIYQTLTISGIKEELEDVKTFTFAEQIAYQPGQYLTLLLPQHQPEVRRSYSVVSAPVMHEPLAIGVKRVENGLFSRWLIDQAKVGDKVQTTGASGFFTLPAKPEAFKQIFFLAAGAGITPIFSLIKTLLFGHPAISVVLIYSNRSQDAAIYRQELEQLAAQFPDRFRLEFLFSNAPDLARARLYKDLLHFFVREFAIVPATEILAYTCGPENYMRMCIYGLELAGVKTENIKKENFSTQKVRIKIEPPDTDPHLVNLKLKGREYSFESQYPDTILKTAQKKGIALPYSCEAGKCGNCAARCTQGQVWMSYNEVLTDREMKQGLVLTCTGYAIKGNIKLEIP